MYGGYQPHLGKPPKNAPKQKNALVTLTRKSFVDYDNPAGRDCSHRKSIKSARPIFGGSRQAAT